MSKILLLGLILPLYPVAAAAENAPPAQPAQIIDQYGGGFINDYPILLERVRVFLTISQQDIVTRLGIFQPSQGFHHPVTIRFTDGAPTTAENPYFYVSTYATDKGFRQELVANVEAFAQHRQAADREDHDLKEGFRYALTHVIFNDLAGGDSDLVLPLWAQEGLAVYFSGEGDELVQEVSAKTPRSKIERLVEGLNETYPNLSKKEYAGYYLAIKYIADKRGTDVLQGFVRSLVAGKTVADTTQEVLNMTWPDFEKEVRTYAYNAYLSNATPNEDSDETPATSTNPGWVKPK